MCMCFCGAGSEILVSSVSHIFSASRILTHLKRPWCWGRLKVGGEGDDRGWDGWMASLTEWKWVWVNPGSWWWTGRPGMLQSMGSQRVGHNWATELNWTELRILTKRAPKWLYQFIVPLLVCKNCCCSTSLPILGIFCFNFNHSGGYIQVFHYHLHLSSMSNGIITQWNTIQPKRMNSLQLHATIWMNLINVIDKGNQTEKNAYCTIPFIDFKKIKTSDETNLWP